MKLEKNEMSKMNGGVLTGILRVIIIVRELVDRNPDKQPPIFRGPYNPNQKPEIQYLKK